ncbi:MAG: energy-coupling factor transporter transmembrane component T [Eubacteriales bacterium]
MVGRVHPFSIATKVIVTACVMVATLSTNGFISYVIFGFALLYLLVQGELKNVFQYTLFYGILCITFYLVTVYKIRLYLFSEFHVFMFWWLTPIFMVSSDLMLSPSGQISAFLSKIKMPNQVILGVLVVFRFFPTMKVECKGILQSMYNRRLLEWKQMLVHPVNSFEYILVPLLMRTIQLSDQLAVSALVRGIEAPYQRMAYYENKTTVRDVFCMMIAIVGCIAVLGN